MKKISLAIMALLVAIAACKKVPEVNLKYVDVERDLITVGTTTATVQCDYQYIATLKNAYFYYGEGENEVDMNKAEMRVVQNTLYIDLAGLKENTTYSYYYEFYNGFNSMRSATKTFKTEASPVTPPEITLPTVVTAEVTEITSNSAQCGGEVTNDGGAEVTERGICWSTNSNPSLNDSHVAVGTGIGAYNATMNGLNENTTYHVRAYAINEKGTAYGLDMEFKTLSGGGGTGDAPEGAVDGLFTINDNGDKVYFSKGNLQYQASTNTWRFAENQWDYVGSQTPEIGNAGGTVSGSDNAGISPTYEGWIDLFGWGTSGWNHGAVCYQPWSTSRNPSDYYAYGSSSYDLYDQTGQADWGYNAISNGSNLLNQWRTLTVSEWRYIFDTRSTLSGIRCAKAVVNGVNGMVLLPDNWNPEIHDLNYTNDGYAEFAFNEITAIDWVTMESNGAVFLPAAGTRRGGLALEFPNVGKYWSSSHGIFPYSGGAEFLIFTTTYTALWTFDNYRYYGNSVRLVRLAE